MKIAWILLFVLGACASRPQLYPNDKYKSVGKKAAQKDVDECMAEAKEFAGSSKGKQITKGAGAGAAIGAAFGAVGGMFTGDLGGGLIRGGAMGGAAGATAGAISPDELKQRYTNQCLADRGYRVLGWD